jgi:CRISPR-associated Csx14 family protein
MTAHFLATLGQRPEIVTLALDLLREREDISSVAVIHTDVQTSGVGEAVSALKPVLAQEYSSLSVRFHEVVRANGVPLADMTDYAAAMDYFTGVYNVLRDYKQKGTRLHFLVSGGRKAMSIYATLAAALVFRQHDRLWTLLSPEALVRQTGQFHAPRGWRERVHLVEMPLLPARTATLLADTEDNPLRLVERLRDKRAHFLAKLQPAQRLLAELLAQHPDATDSELARMLHQSTRTVEGQLRRIYPVMIGYIDNGERIRHKRQALIDFLLGRE